MIPPPDAGPTTFLALWHNAVKQDHVLLASEEGRHEATRDGYTLLRSVGCVYEEDRPGHLPLHLMYSEERQDHALVTKRDLYEKKGYVWRRVEGYVNDWKVPMPGQIPLTTYYSEARGDTLGVADAATLDAVSTDTTYSLRKMECRILPVEALSPRRAAAAAVGPDGGRVPVGLQNSELYDFTKMSTQELEGLTRAVVNIQRIFRGHTARLSFQGKQSVWDSVVDRAVDHERTTKRLQQLESILSGLDEALLAMGADTTDISSLTTLSQSVRAKYNSKVDELVQQREAARERLSKMKQVVGEPEEGSPNLMMRAANVVRKRLLQMLGLIVDTDVGDQLDSQQTAWQTEPIFRAIVTGDFLSLKKVVMQDASKVHARDHFGATPLLVAFLLDGLPQHKMIKWLLNRSPMLAQDMYTTDFFAGEICLHLSIIHRDMEMTQLLLNKYPMGLLQRATGIFFRDRLEGAYYGEWPLMFAISTNQPDMVLYLLEFGEKHCGKKRHEMLDMRDTDANTVLHMCVWHNLPDMYEMLEMFCKEYPQPSFYECGLTSCYNVDGLTPFTLAAERGHLEVFSHLLEANTQVTWKYGPHSYRAVFIDEIEPSGLTDEKPAVLQLLVDNNHLQLLYLPLIRNFLDCKWTHYVKRVFYKRLCMVAFYCACFMIAGLKDKSTSTGCFSAHISTAMSDAQLGANTSYYLRPLALGYSNFDEWGRCEVAAIFLFTGWWDLLERVADLIVLFGALWKGSKEFGELTESGLSGYFGVKGSMLLENVLSSTFCLFSALGYVARCFQNDVEDLFSAVSALLLWAYVLWLLLGFKQTGPFIIMIWKMLMNDMIQFLVIFVTFQLGFTQAFYLILDTSSKSASQSGYLFLRHLKATFEVLLGETNLEIPTDMTYPLVAYLLMVVYVILVTILLLNLLIAMMSTTYSEIQEEADIIWNMEFSRMILSLESELTPKEKQRTKWWSIVEGRRCFMLPMLTTESKTEYFAYEPDWNAIASHRSRPLRWAERKRLEGDTPTLPRK